MIELIDKKSNLLQANMALTLSRCKRKGYVVVGVGYPFFRNEFQGLIDLCDWFVDDLQCEHVPGWEELYLIKDVADLEKVNKFVVLLLSNNRMNILSKIESSHPNVPIYKFYEDSYTHLSTISDIENSSCFTLHTLDTDPVSIINGINVNGTCSITQKGSSLLKIHSLTLNEGSFIKSNSRNVNHIDTLILSKEAKVWLDLDSTCSIRNCYLGKNSKLHIYAGQAHIEDVYFGDNCVIHVYDKLNIGSGSVFSWNVSILDGDGHTLETDKKTNSAAGITIGRNVWVGNNTIILKGVNIGEGSVIGAGSVVTHSIPPHSLAVGNPAKVIKTNVKWDYGYKF